MILKINVIYRNKFRPCAYSKAFIVTITTEFYGKIR